MFGDVQMSALADMIQAAPMLKYNQRKVGCESKVDAARAQESARAESEAQDSEECTERPEKFEKKEKKSPVGAEKKSGPGQDEQTNSKPPSDMPSATKKGNSRGEGSTEETTAEGTPQQSDMVTAQFPGAAARLDDTRVWPPSEVPAACGEGRGLG